MVRKIMLIFGTRPEAIKMVPIIKALETEREHFKPIICVSSQHRQLLEQVLRVFDIRPDIDLNIMQPQQDLYDITSRILIALRDVLHVHKPDLVLVHGDTTTTLAASLASFYQRIPVGHVEAGLRTHHIYSPWPEEMNRQLVGRMARYHFAPTLLNKENLLRENISEDTIFVTGNTIIDALQWTVKKIATDKQLRQELVAQIRDSGYDISRVTADKKMILITGHRRENFGEGFKQIFRAIQHLNKQYPEVDFVYPMHLNPCVRKSLEDVFGRHVLPNMFFIEALDYWPFVYLMEKSTFILTDSGGIQEEAPCLGKPVLVMRDTTERPEVVKTGHVKLVGASYENIIHEVNNLLCNKQSYQNMVCAQNPYGDGKAGLRIVDVLKKHCE